MSLLDLPNELLLPTFSRLIGQFIHALVLNPSIFTYRLWDPVTTLQLVSKPTRTLVLSICRQIAALPAHDPHQIVDPVRSVPRHIARSSPTLKIFSHRIIAPYRGLAFNSLAACSSLLSDNTAPPLLQAYAALASALHACSAPFISQASSLQVDEAVPFLVTAEYLARQVNPPELSELVFDRIEQHSELIVWGKERVDCVY